MLSDSEWAIIDRKKSREKDFVHLQTVCTPTGNKDLELIKPRENARHVPIEA